MSLRKEKARPGTAIPGRAMETEAPCKMTTASTEDSTTPAAERQPPRIADLLHPGAENAVPRRGLMALTGLSDRELWLMIEAERRQGIPILSDNVNGYYLPVDKAERDRFVNSMLYRAMEIASVAAAVGQAEV